MTVIEVILERQVVALMQLDLLTSKQRESSGETHSDSVFLSEGGRATDVPNHVSKIQPSSAKRKCSFHSFECPSSILNIRRRVVSPGELSLYLGSFIDNEVVLLNPNITPVRYLNLLQHFSKVNQSNWGAVQETNFLACLESSHLCIFKLIDEQIVSLERPLHVGRHCEVHVLISC